MKKVALHNLGCKVNSYEYDVMQQNLQKNGFEIVPFSEKADVYIVNTCSVTNIADRKSRQMLHRAKTLNPEALVVATGCYVQTGTETLKEDPYVDLLVSNNRKSGIADIILKALSASKEGTAPALVKKQCSDLIEINDPVPYEKMQLEDTTEKTRATIKIQDGCNQFCSYCIIPFARGRVRSRSPQDIFAEIEALGKKGFREFVITGIHLSSYGVDFEEKKTAIADYMVSGSRLPEVLTAINAIPCVKRIRLGSLEPRIITDSFLEALKGCDKLCPHFHLSLQSACNETLTRMNRHYTIEDYEARVAKIREVFPRAAITTDVIVGFPGETGEEFQKTYSRLQSLKLYEIHVFKYSKRKGTRAAVMPDQVADTVKESRSNLLLDLTAEQSAAFRATFIGKPVEVLLEEEKIIDGVAYLCGYTREYVYAALPVEETGTDGNGIPGGICGCVGRKMADSGKVLIVSRV